MLKPCKLPLDLLHFSSFMTMQVYFYHSIKNMRKKAQSVLGTLNLSVVIYITEHNIKADKYPFSLLFQAYSQHSL